ncbi:serine/arginine repetitive matrix protein 1-like [Hyposmocoma kahamanoa]|uniref:serine/arginine repetitive matrix protein 1-like n=1 Tax=Hyposmocoma kahamanoa TaxID=1477025 RepID=UPI000E6DA3F6|nr:serine/arginine repetitive matrix protein 1-like [Hyposmocoma kahamanoa]
MSLSRKSRTVVLARHGEKPYACAVCPRAFNQRVVLREHVRSHHSAPERRPNGGPAYCCVVCGRTLHSSAELVQHLIQHCDANTALKRQPQSGPRKYKRRRKLKAGTSPPNDWGRGSLSPASLPAPSPPPSPSPPPPAESPPPAPRARRRRRQPEPPPRPRMIHTEEPRARIKQVRARRPPRHPADDLRAIQPTLNSRSPSPQLRSPKLEDEVTETVEAGGPYKCEMCSMEFARRDALLLHVPVHI